MNIINTILKNPSKDSENYNMSMLKKDNYFIFKINKVYDGQAYPIEYLKITFYNSYNKRLNSNYDISHFIDRPDGIVKLNISDYVNNLIKDYYNVLSITERDYPIISKTGTIRLKLQAGYTGLGYELYENIEWILLPSRNDEFSIIDNQYYNNVNKPIYYLTDYTTYKPFYYFNDYPCHLTYQFKSRVAQSIKNIMVSDKYNVNVNSLSKVRYDSVELMGRLYGGNLPSNVNNFDINNTASTLSHYLQNGTDYNNNLFRSGQEYPILEDNNGKFIHLEYQNRLAPTEIFISSTKIVGTFKHNIKFRFTGTSIDSYMIAKWSNTNFLDNVIFGINSQMIYINNTTKNTQLFINIPKIKVGEINYFTFTFNSITGRLRLYLNSNEIYDDILSTNILPTANYKFLRPIYDYERCDVFALNSTFESYDTNTADNIINLIDMGKSNSSIKLKEPNTFYEYEIKVKSKYHTCSNSNTLVKWLGKEGVIKTYLFNSYKKLNTSSEVITFDDYHIENYSYTSNIYKDNSISKLSEYKDVEYSIEIGANLTDYEYYYVNDITYSPYIWIWVGHEFAPNIEENWKAVLIDTKNIEINTKKNNSDFNLKFKYK